MAHLCDTSLPQQTRDYLYDHNLALHGCFVVGEPAIITTNINPLLGLANGTKVEMKSICLHADEDTDRIQYLLTKENPETDVVLDHPPLYIGVRVINPTDLLKAQPGANLTSGPDVVIPIYAEMSVEIKVMYRVQIPLKTLPHGLELAFSMTAHKV